MRVLLRPRPRPKQKVDSPFRVIRWLEMPSLPSATSLRRRFRDLSFLARKKSSKREKKPNILLESIKHPPKIAGPGLGHRFQRFWKQATFFLKRAPKSEAPSVPASGIGLNMWFAIRKDMRGVANPAERKRIAGWLLIVASTSALFLVTVEGVLQLSSVVCWAVVRLKPTVAPDPERLILCAGDSFTAGKFSSNSIQPYTTYLEKTLNDSGELQWKVLNFSSEYFRSDDLIRGISRTLQLQRPSLVYISVGMNDFSRPPAMEETTNFDEPPFPRTKFFLQSWRGLRYFSSMAEVVAIPPPFLLKRPDKPELPFSQWGFSRLLEASRNQSTQDSKPAADFISPNVRSAWNLLQNRDYNNADIAFRELVKKDPVEPFVHAGLAELNYRFGFNEKAEEEIQWLRRQYESRSDLASAYALLHSFPFEHSAEDTLRLLMPIMDRFPASAELWQTLATNCALIGNQEMTARAMQRVLDLIPAQQSKRKAEANRHYAALIGESEPLIALQKLVAADSLDRDDQAFQRAVSKLSPYFQNIKIDSDIRKAHANDEQRKRLVNLYIESTDRSFSRSSLLFERHLTRLLALCRRYRAQPIFVSYPLTRPYVDDVFERVSRKTGTAWINLSIPFEKLLLDPKQRPKLMYKGSLTDEASRRIGQWIAADTVYRFKKLKG